MNDNIRNKVKLRVEEVTRYKLSEDYILGKRRILGVDDILEFKVIEHDRIDNLVIYVRYKLEKDGELDFEITEIFPWYK